MVWFILRDMYYVTKAFGVAPTNAKESARVKREDFESVQKIEVGLGPMRQEHRA